MADIKNIGARGQAGAISAAWFLKPFAEDIPWAHLDIAGPAYTERESRPDLPYGASGYGVRLLFYSNNRRVRWSRSPLSYGRLTSVRTMQGRAEGSKLRLISGFS